MLLPSVFACPTVGWQSPLRVQATRAVSGPCLPESGGLRPGGSFNHAGLIAFVVRTETAAAEWAPGPGKPCADQRPDPQVSLPAPPPRHRDGAGGGVGQAMGQRGAGGAGHSGRGSGGLPRGVRRPPPALPPGIILSASATPLPRKHPAGGRAGAAAGRSRVGGGVAWRAGPPPRLPPRARPPPRAPPRGSFVTPAERRGSPPPPPPPLAGARPCAGARAPPLPRSAAAAAARQNLPAPPPRGAAAMGAAAPR